MPKKLAGILSLAAINLMLSNCSVDQLNAINKITENIKNLKDITININANVNAKDISAVLVDNTEVPASTYTNSNNQINLPSLPEGNHVVKIKHKKYGDFEFPVEVSKDSGTNYQFNPNIANDKINDWEVGIDANKDGNIDPNTFSSTVVNDYVVIKESSGSTNYLPKQRFEQDYRAQKVYPKPKDFPENNVRNDPGFQPKPVFLPKEQYQNTGSVQVPPTPTTVGNPNIPPDIISEKVYIPFPKQLDGYKITNILLSEQLMPEESYSKENDSIVIKSEFLRGKKELNLNVYLIDETGQGVLLVIHPHKPLFHFQDRSLVTSNQEIHVDGRDIDYTLEKNTTLDSGMLEKLKQTNNLVKPGPLNREPGTRSHNIPGTGFQSSNSNFIVVPQKMLSNSSGAAKTTDTKMVKIDENGEIVDFIDNQKTASDSGDYVTVNDSAENGQNN